jgi:large repetitive protein
MASLCLEKPLHLSTGETMIPVHDTNASANGSSARNSIRRKRFSTSLIMKARGTVKCAPICLISLMSLVHASGQKATNTTISASGSPGNYTLTSTVSGPAGPGIAPTGSVSFEDTSNGNFVLGAGNLGAPTVTQSFIQKPSPATTFAPNAVAIADFNGDGKPDIVIEDEQLNQLDLFLGNGDGTFSGPTVISVPGTGGDPQNGPSGIVVADFNKDGKPDLAVIMGDGGFSSVAILLGNGDGTFTTAAISGTPNSSTVVAVGDFNSDGNPDFVKASQVLNQFGINVFLGNGSGGFTQVADGTPDTNLYFYIVVGDFNGDGKPDLFLVTDLGTPCIRLGNGDGTFQASITVPGVTGLTSQPIIGDFNGDGKLDVALTTSSSIDMLLGNGNGTFSISTVSSLSGVGELVAADFNADGKRDLLATTTTGFILFLGNGNGTFQAPTPLNFSAPPANLFSTTTIATADLNGDGNPDLVMSSTSDSMSVFLDNAIVTATATLTGVSIPGGGTHFADAVFPGNSNYLTSTSSLVPLIGSPVPTALTLQATPSSSVPGQQVALTAVLSPFSVGSMSTNGEPILFSIGGSSIGSALLSSGVATLQTTSLPTGAETVTAKYQADTNFQTSSATTSINVAKTTPTITWANPAAITFGTPLSGLQLNATASTPGTMTYSPVAGTVLGAGPQTLSVNFTPTDTTNFNNASATVTLIVNKATPTITWANPAAITYGTALTGIQLDATASTPGTLTYSPVAGTVLGAGPQTLSVAFTPSDTADFNNQTATVTLIVNKATPTIAWANPAAITYGTALTGIQLDATASMPGTLTYSPMAGTVLGGGPQTLSVAFTPTDTADFNNQTATVTLIVNKATPTITWPNPAVITYGTPLSGTQLDATASVPGTFIYSPTTGTILGAGKQTLSVTFTPTDGADYNPTAGTAILTVNKAVPVITWTNPSSITYGMALTGTQLNATSSVPGSFIYSPTAGTILGAGSKTLSVSFTPTDGVDYFATTAEATIAVTKAAAIGSVRSSINPATFSLSVTLTFTYRGAPGLPVPTGSISVVDGGNALVTLPLNAAGVATFTTSDLTVGSHGLVVTYGGDANYQD